MDDGDFQVLARLPLSLFVAVMGVLTFVTHACQITGVRFSTYSVLSALASVGVVVAVARPSHATLIRRAIASNPGTASSLFLCCVISVGLGLVSFRPDTDDVFYAANVVYFLEHPAAPVDFALHFVDVGEVPFVAFHRGPMPFELVQGTASFLTGLPFLTVYYLVAPALFCFMLPLAWFYLLTRFRGVRCHAAVAGTVLICLSLLLMGDEHRAHGNFAFNRICQGKTVLLAMVIHVFVAYSMDFFRSPTRGAWLRLFATATAAGGLSASAAALVPMLAFVVSISAAWAYLPGHRRLLGLLRYALVLAYPLAYAASMLVLSMDQVGAESPLNKAESRFSHEVSRTIGALTLPAFVIGTCVSMFHVAREDRRFLTAWMTAAVVLYLNPLVAPIVMKLAAPVAIYWRVVYLLPFPLVLGLAGCALARRLEPARKGWRLAALGGAATVLIAAHVPEWSTSVFKRGTRFSPFRYKVAGLDQARAVLELRPPPGTMLAPREIARPIVLLTSRHPQLVARIDGISTWMAALGRPEDARQRIRISTVLRRGNPTDDELGDLVALVQSEDRLRSVLVGRRAATAALADTLAAEGFVRSGATEWFVLFARRAPA